MANLFLGIEVVHFHVSRVQVHGPELEAGPSAGTGVRPWCFCQFDWQVVITHFLSTVQNNHNNHNNQASVPKSALCLRQSAAQRRKQRRLRHGRSSITQFRHPRTAKSTRCTTTLWTNSVIRSKASENLAVNSSTQQ